MSKRTDEMTRIYTGEDAGRIARHKSHYGHKDWFIWRDRNNVLHSARATAGTCKMAMLATGTQGKFIMVSGDSGITLSSSCWRVAVAWWANLKAGYWM